MKCLYSSNSDHTTPSSGGSKPPYGQLCSPCPASVAALSLRSLLTVSCLLTGLSTRSEFSGLLSPGKLCGLGPVSPSDLFPVLAKAGVGADGPSHPFLLLPSQEAGRGRLDTAWDEDMKR